VAKLGTAETGDTLSDKDHPLLMEPWSMPEPLLPVAIVAKSKADEDKLSQALSRLVAEDPTLRLENNAETRQLVLWCMGEAHADVLLDRLTHRHGVAVETTDLRVPLRETIAGKAQGLGRNVKQTGGHGEFGICHIEVEPLTDSGGFEFVDKIVGGVVPRQFIPSVEKGVRWQMEQGVTAGYPMTGVRVTLYDGKAHPVDSSDMAFQKAGRAALRDAVDKAGCSAQNRSGSAGRWSRRRSRNCRSPGTPSTCVRYRTARDRLPGPTCGTSRSPPTWPPRSPPTPSRTSPTRPG
jgi:elongation factor G